MLKGNHGVDKKLWGRDATKKGSSFHELLETSWDHDHDTSFSKYVDAVFEFCFCDNNMFRTFRILSPVTKTQNCVELDTADRPQSSTGIDEPKVLKKPCSTSSCLGCAR